MLEQEAWVSPLVARQILHGKIEVKTCIYFLYLVAFIKVSGCSVWNVFTRLYLNSEYYLVILQQCGFYLEKVIK